MPPKQPVTVLKGNASWLLKAAFAVYIAVMAYGVWTGVTSPVRNWDMLGYMGSIVSMDTKDPVQIHDKVLAEVKPAVWPELYEEFSQKNELSANADNFYRQIPFYNIKPLYVASVWVVNKLGAGLAQSTWLVSTASFVMLALLLAMWKPQDAPRSLWLLGVAGLSILGHFSMKKLAGYSTPDALNLVLMMLGFMVWLRNRSIFGYALCMILSVLARPDGLLQSLALTVYLMLFAAPSQRLDRLSGIATGVAIVGAYLGIRFLLGSADWNTLFYRAFINMNYDFTQNGPVEISWKQYWYALSTNVIYLATNFRLLFFIGFSALAVFCHYSLGIGKRQWVWLVAITWATFCTRFLLFPIGADERYYYYYYLLVLMGSLELIGPLLTSYKLVRKK